MSNNLLPLTDCPLLQDLGFAVATIVLQQVSSRYARQNEGKTLDKPVALKYLREISEDEMRKLEAVFPAGHVYVWGSKFERVHQYGKIPYGNALVLFRRARSVYKCGVIKHWLWNEGLANRLWGMDDSGETWSLIFFLAEVHSISLDASVINEILGRKASDNWQGFTAVVSPQCADVVRRVKHEIDQRPNGAVNRD